MRTWKISYRVLVIKQIFPIECFWIGRLRYIALILYLIHAQEVDPSYEIWLSIRFQTVHSAYLGGFVSSKKLSICTFLKKYHVVG